MVEKIDAIIEKSTPTLRQLYYTNEALRGAIEFGSTYLIMDNIKKALKEKNDSLLQASKKQLENAYDGIHNKDYDHEVDRAVAKAILPALAKALNADELPSFYQTINEEFKGDYNAYVDNILRQLHPLQPQEPGQVPGKAHRESHRERPCYGLLTLQERETAGTRKEIHGTGKRNGTAPQGLHSWLGRNETARPLPIRMPTSPCA